MQLNAWFGPQNTISPLHHDPHHNLLCQVVGRKYLRLYPHEASTRLYPHPDPLLNNTSQMDVANPDVDRFPLVAGLACLECILEPGEMLYIPPKYWHYVRALSISFSVSCWWS